jgi:hypothetical protein
MRSEKVVFVPTREQRNRVEDLVAADVEIHLIASDIKVSKTILKRHFQDELKYGKALVRKRAMSELFKQGLKQGSIPALKAIIALTTETTAPDGDANKSATAMRLGKKETQKIEADAANKGLYATPEAPKASLQ